jgi:cytochrome c oxidase assembly factor CtaG
MDDITRAILLSWEIRPAILLPLLLIGAAFTRGWLTLRKMSRSRERGLALAAGWRLVSYWSGLLLVGIALLSPIDTLSSSLFFMHMVQHLLLAMFAPPLLLIANPMPIIMWGLPLRWRHVLGDVLFNRNALVRPWLTKATQPVIVWFVWVVFLWGWHDSDAYSWALRNDFVHDVEHFTFFWTAMFLWWHTTGAAPRFHKRMGYLPRMGFAIASIPPNMILGVILSFASRPIYAYYEAVPRLWGIDIVTDQQIGGVIMWVPGSMMYLIAGLIVFARWISQQEAQSQRDKMLAR